jgi:predicted transcriptional regulator
MKIISLTRESREKVMISDAEGIILMALYNMNNGMSSSDIKGLLLHMVDNPDEIEEAFDSLRSEGYIGCENKRWYITEDGKNLIKDIATFKERMEED